MKREINSLKGEVKELLNRSTLAETKENVWSAFERALSNFDKTTLVALRMFFNGGSHQEIARRLEISEIQSKDLLQKAKRNLVENLRRDCKIKQ